MLVGDVDLISLLIALGLGEGLDLRFDDRQCSYFIVQTVQLLAVGDDGIGVRLEFAPYGGDLPVDVGYLSGDKLVDQLQLRLRAVGDVLHLVLTENVSAEDAAGDGRNTWQ